MSLSQQEFKEGLEQFKADLIGIVQEQVALRVKEEIKNEIITKIVKEVKSGNDRVVDHLKSIDDRLQNMDDHFKNMNDRLKGVESEISTGFYQTHNLLANIAGLLSKIESKL